VKKIDEFPSETWNGGLAFKMANALADGDIVSSDEVTVEGGNPMGSVTWKLVLLPSI
jgi:hypothetical protein